MIGTGMYCTNCGNDLEFGDDVIVKAIGYVAGHQAGDGWIYTSDGPFLQTLCLDCGGKLIIPIEQKPNRKLLDLIQEWEGRPYNGDYTKAAYSVAAKQLRAVLGQIDEVP